MKRLLVLVLLVPILALTMISCDADMRSNIANLMGGFGGNVYEDAGLIVANTAQAEAAAAAVAVIGTPESVETADTSGLGVTISAPAAGTKILTPQTPAKQTELKNNLADALNSETQKKQLLVDLKKPVTDVGQKEAAQGTVAVFNATLAALGTELNKGDTASQDLGAVFGNLILPEVGDSPTQGDMLALQLMTDLISNTIATLNSIGGGVAGDGGTGLTGVTAANLAANKDRVLTIIDEALFAAQMAEQLSGAADIDFTTLAFDSLIGVLDNQNQEDRTKARGEPITLTDAADFIDTINALAPSIVELMGVTYEDPNFAYAAAKYQSFLLTQQIYRASIDQATMMMELSTLTKADIDSLTFDTSTLVKYALAVFITEHDAFWKSEAAKDLSDPKTITPIDQIITGYLNEASGNKKLGLGTLETTDVLIQPTDFTGFDYANWPTFLSTGKKDKAFYQGIISNIIRVSDLGGISQLTPELKKFYDPAHPEATDDGLSDWYNGL